MSGCRNRVLVEVVRSAERRGAVLHRTRDARPRAVHGSLAATPQSSDDGPAVGGAKFDGSLLRAVTRSTPKLIGSQGPAKSRCRAGHRLAAPGRRRLEDRSAEIRLGTGEAATPGSGERVR